MWRVVLLLPTALALLAVVWVCRFLRRRAHHWAVRGLPHLRPRLLFGHACGVVLSRQSCGQAFNELYSALEGHALAGFCLLWRPALLVRDPALAARILVTDFDFFRDRGLCASDPLMQDLFFLRGDHRWRKLRDSLEPGFGPRGARQVFSLLDEMAQRLVEVLEGPAKRGLELDLFDQMQRFAIDTIGTCAFGVEFDSMRNGDCLVAAKARDISANSFLRKIKKTLVLAAPAVARALGVSFLRAEDAAVFRWLTAEIVAHRRRHNVRRNDLIELLLAAADHWGTTSASGSSQADFGGELLGPQVQLLLILGRQKLAAALAFCLHLLAVHPEAQTRARLQVDAALRKHDRRLSVDALDDMPYLDMVLSETLRLHPPLSNLSRGCTAAYRFPGATSAGDGCLALSPGEAPLHVPVSALHRDARLFPQPDSFLPERFSAEQRPRIAPFSYLPFGAGPRSCLGERLSMLLMKTTLARLLSRYELFRSPRTEYPAPVDPRVLLLHPKGGLWVKISNRHWLPCD